MMRAVLATVVLLAATSIVLATAREPPVPQPVAFNHRRHTEDLKLDCAFCHQYVTTGAHAGLPDAQICVICHRAPAGKSPEAARVSELLAAGDSLRFRKLFRLASHVRYTHRRHVGIAQLECPNCHGGIASTERPPGRPLVRITMDLCLDCHRARGQTVDCVACHR